MCNVLVAVNIFQTGSINDWTDELVITLVFFRNYK